MTRSRWKLAAGGLALSLGGLAAVAGVPSKPGAAPDAPAVCGIPVYITAKAKPQPPVELPPPPAAEPPTPTLPSPTLPTPSLPPASVATPAELPALPLPPVVEDKKVTPAAGTAPTPTLPDAPKPTLPALPAPEAPKPTAPAIEFPKPTPTLPEPAARAELPALTPQTQPPPADEKKLKVILQMGDERPRFEVRDGDEVYLKVVCDRVEVKSPSDRGEMMSTLKATGRSTFITPGGEGVCDELTVVPGTGQVVVTGKVSFKYNWGKVETTVSGDRMTFRLGTAPGMATSPTTIPASFKR